MSHELLVPRPREAIDLEGTFAPPEVLTVRGPEAGESAIRWLESALAGWGVERRSPAGGEASIRLRLEPSPELGGEGYGMHVRPSGVEITAATAAGLFYGAVTLGQWMALAARRGAPSRGPVPAVRIRDAPDFPVRGAMLDVSRCRVPTQETLRHLVDLLASLKINHLQLYTEHTFAYRGHEAVWRDASPLTPDDIRELDAHCAARHIELTPNQQSFGHLHRWLVHPAYRHLAECPEGVAHPFSDVPEPFSLDPLHPDVPSFLADLYDQLLPCFRGELLNVGLDETLDLGLGASAEACRQRGRHRVYLDFLRRVHALAAARGRRILFWGDVLLEHPELLAEVPADAVVLEWGYEADHPFAAKARQLAASGRERWVCPGTSSWNSFAGRTRNMLLNLASAARAGHASGAAGYLITDWGDYGHLQPLPVSYPGWTAGAAFSWNVASAARPLDLPLAELLDRHVFHDPAGAMGRAISQLGETYRCLDAPPKNGSALFFLTVFALHERERERIAGASLEGFERVLDHVTSARSSIAAARSQRDNEARSQRDNEARSQRDDAALLQAELEWVADMLEFSARLGRARWLSGDLESFAGIPAGERRQLAGALRQLVARHRQLFTARSRPGGLDESARRLLRVVDLLAGE